jgi:hypothetical protein
VKLFDYLAAADILGTVDATDAIAEHKMNTWI